jgi:hypothetical protein
VAQTRSLPNALALSIDIAEGSSPKEMQYTSSPKQSLSERLKLRSLLERLSSPTLQCSTTGIESIPSVMRMSSKKGPKMNQEQILTNNHTSEEKDVRKTSTTTGAMNQSTDDQRLIRDSSPGWSRTGSKGAHYEMSAPLPETSLLTTPLMSNSPRLTSSTQGLHQNSQTQSGSPSCWVPPSTLTQSSADGVLR